MAAARTRRTAAQRLSAAGEALLRAEHRIDRWIRPAIDRFVRPPLQAAVQRLALRRGSGAGLGLAEERALPDEAELVRGIVAQMSAFLVREYAPGTAERAGNTKTYGVVRGVLRVLPGLAPELRHGLFAQPAEHPAWVRLAGPGPLSPPDLDDHGILSLAVKVMDVPGPTLLEDEQHTQDFTGLTAPTFTTPDLRANLELQRAVYDGTGLLYFLRHPVDLVMQGLYAKVHANPLEARYWSCVPYLLGPGQAVQYSFVPRASPRTAVPRHPGPDYLRDALRATLAQQAVVFDLLVMLQTDPRRMPIEDASVVWPERLSPWRAVAELELPVQRVDAAQERELARSLSFNPWHCLPEHRPLGNQGRGRREIYLELSRLRQRMNGTPHTRPAAPPRPGAPHAVAHPSRPADAR